MVTLTRDPESGLYLSTLPGGDLNVAVATTGEGPAQPEQVALTDLWPGLSGLAFVDSAALTRKHTIVAKLREAGTGVLGWIGPTLELGFSVHAESDAQDIRLASLFSATLESVRFKADAGTKVSITSEELTLVGSTEVSAAGDSMNHDVDFGLSIPLAGPETGRIRARIEAPDAALAAVGIETRYSYGDDYISTLRVPVFSNEGASSSMRLEMALDPLANSNPERSEIRFLDNEVGSLLQTPWGEPLSLVPTGEGPSRARLVPSLWSNDELGEPDEVYWTPSGQFEVIGSQQATHTRGALMLGTEATERVSMRIEPGNGDRLEFHPGQPAHVPVELTADQTDTPQLERDNLTAWVSIRPGRDGRSVGFYDEAPDAALYAKPDIAAAQALLPAEFVISKLAANALFPLLPFRGVGRQGSHPDEAEALRRLDRDCLAPARRARLSEAPSLSSDAMDATANAPLNSKLATTPQGLVLDFDPNSGRWQRLILGDTGERTYGLTILHDDVKDALLRSELFLVMTRMDNLFDDYADIEIEGWTFTVWPIADTLYEPPVAPGKPGQPIVVFKFKKGKLRDLLKERSGWARADRFNDPARLTTVERRLKRIAADLKRDPLKADKLYDKIRQVFDDPDWTGVIVFDGQLSVKAFPSDAACLSVGIDLDEFVPHHVGIEINDVEDLGSDRPLERTSSFGLIDYRRPSPGETGGYNFSVERLAVRFAGGLIQDFVSRATFEIPELFDQTGKLFKDVPLDQKCGRGGVPADNLLPIVGSFARRGDKRFYSFVLDSVYDLKLDPAEVKVMDCIRLSKAQLATINVSEGKIKARLGLWGKIRLTDALDGLTFDLLSFDSLDFEDLGFTLEMDSDDPGDVNISFDPGETGFSVSAGPRAKSLAHALGLKLKKFLISAGRFLFPKDVFSLGGSDNEPCERVKYALVLEFDAGYLGTLSSKKRSFPVQIWFGWCPNSGFRLGVSMPESKGGKKEIGVQGVLKLRIEDFSLFKQEISATRSALGLGLEGVTLDVLGMKLPPGGRTSAYLFADGERPFGEHGIGWFMGWMPEDSDAAFKYVGIGQKVDLKFRDVPVNYLQVRKTLEMILGAIRDEDPPGGGNPFESPYLLKRIEYSPPVEWIIASELVVADSFMLGLVFYDPTLYGLRLELKQTGWAFDITYRKVTDEIGVYQIEIGLPDSIRKLEMGAVSITVPNVGLSIFTNGDFLIDIGYPEDLNFERSFDVEALPFKGGGGIYFGITTSAAARLLPQQDGDPEYRVHQVGLAMRLGLGKDFRKGPLRAGLVIAFYGMVEGAIANRPRNVDGAIGNGRPIPMEVYLLQGRFGVMGEIYGSVDFKIVRAAVMIRIWAEIGVRFQTSYKTLLWVEAGVSVRVVVVIGKIKIFGKTIRIKVSFSFRTTVRFDWAIGSGRTPTSLLAAGAASALTWSEATVLPSMVEEAAPLTLFFSPEVTVHGGQVNVVAMLGLRQTGNAIDAPPEDFDKLVMAVSEWTLVHVLGPDGATKQLSKDDLDLVEDRIFSSPPNYADLSEFLKTRFEIKLEGLPSAVSEDFYVTVFPMPLGLQFEIAPSGGDPYGVDFGNMATYDDDYERWLEDFFAQSQPTFSDDAATGTFSSAGSGKPIVQIVFEEYFTFIARTMIDRLQRAWVDSETGGRSFGELLGGAQTFPTMGAMTNRFFRHGMRLPLDTHVTDTEALYVMSGQQHPLPPVNDDSTIVRMAESVSHSDHWLSFGQEPPEDTILAAGHAEYAAVSVDAANIGGDIVAIPPVEVRPRAYSVNVEQPWFHIGAAGDEPRRLYDLPPTLISDVRTSSNGSVSVAAIVGSVGGLKSSVERVVKPNWATRFRIRVARVPAMALADDDGFAPDLYEVLGADEGTRRLLRALSELDLSGAAIELGFVDEAHKLITRSRVASRVLIAKGNLSTETKPFDALGLAMRSPSRDRLTVASVDYPGDFLALLRQAATVNDGGFYLHAPDDRLDPDMLTLRGDLEFVITHGEADVFDVAAQHNAVWLSHEAIGDAGVDEMSSDQLVLRATRLTTAVPVRPAGSLAFRLDRPNPDLAEPDLARREVLRVYNLLEYSLVADDHFESGADSLPVGPKPPEEVEPGIEEDPHRQTNEPWRYEQTVPVHKYARLDANSTPPVEGRNPYAGVGRDVRLRVRFRDVYGNRMPGEREQGFPLRYFDPLLPVDEWPVVAASYEPATADDGRPMIRTTLRFDGDQIPTEARDDVRQSLCLAAHQLTGPGVSVALESTLLGGARAISADDLVENFLRNAIRFLDDGTPVASYAIDVPADMSGIPGDLVALDVALVFSRDTSLLDPSLPDSSDPDIQGAIKRVASVRSVVAANLAADQGSDDTREPPLRRFAGQFEAALPEWKLATAHLQPGTRSLWAIRRSLALFTVDDDPPRYYAPRPVSNELWSGPVSFGDDGMREIVDLDVDRQTADFLDVLDRNLTGQQAAALARLERQAFTDIGAYRRTLATKFANLTEPVLVGPDPGDPAIEEARELVRQRVLRTSSSAYSLETVAQMSARVSNQAVEDVQLFGSVVDNNAPLSTAKILVSQAQNGPSTLTFGVDVPDPASAADVQLSPAFHVTHIEHSIEGEPGTPYQRSSWLSLVIPEVIPLVNMIVPIPLRVFPTSPVLDNHSFEAVWQSGQPLGATDQWRYSFEFKALLADQDTIRCEPGVNHVTPMSLLAEDGPPLPEALVRFFAEWTPSPSAQGSSLSERFEKLISAARVFDQGGVDHPDVQEAIAAIQLFRTLVRNVTESNWNLGSGQSTTTLLPECDASRLESLTESQWLRFVPETPVLSLRRENLAWGAVQVTRNEGLIDGVATNPSFIYATTAVRFPNSLTPMIVNEEPFCISQLPRTNAPGPLEDHIAAALLALFDGTPQHRNTTLRLEVRHLLDPRGRSVEESTIREGRFITEFPVLLFPPWQLDLDVDSDSSNPAGFARRLSAHVHTWCQEHGASPRSAFRLNLTVLSDSEPSIRIPTLRISKLWVPIRDIVWSDSGDTPSGLRPIPIDAK